MWAGWTASRWPGAAPDGQSALRLLTEFSAAGSPVELVLLDMNLPDLHGLDIARRMRSAGHLRRHHRDHSCSGADIVRSAVSIGVVQYLIKPFTYATFADKLDSYRQFREQLAATGGGLGAGSSVTERRGPGLREPSGAVRTAAAQGPGPVHARRPSRTL